MNLPAQLQSNRVCVTYLVQLLMSFFDDWVYSTVKCFSCCVVGTIDYGGAVVCCSTPDDRYTLLFLFLFVYLLNQILCHSSNTLAESMPF